MANAYGIWLTNGARQNLIHDNSLGVNSKHGVWLERSYENRVEANQITGSSGAGVALQGSDGNVVVGNTILENDGHGVLLGITDSGGIVGLPSNDNLVEGNTILESGNNGIEVHTSEGNQLIDNVATGANGYGIRLYFANETIILRNDVTGNKNGIVLMNSSDSRLEGNDASNSDGAGISLADLSASNVVIGNTSSNNDGVGIYVGDEVGAGQGTLIEGNRTHNNNSYGIHVPKVSHTVKNNIANDNGSWGIYASEGSNGRVNVDGGGNRAQGNLGPIDPFTLDHLQCYTIRCEGGGQLPSEQIPPDTLILDGPSDPTADDVATFHFAGSDNASAVTLECRLDSDLEVDFEPCVSPASFPVEVGDHVFAVRAIDASGNVDPTPAVHEWTVIPSGAPQTTIVSGPDLTTVQTTATFEFSADQAGSTFECSLDGAAFVPCTSPRAYWVVTDGIHEFEVRATNPEGVVESTPAVYEWVVALGPDTTRPDTTITAGPRQPADPSTIATFRFTGSDNRTPPAGLTFECALDGPSFNSCVSPQQFSDLERGSHVMLIRARDAAGNFDPTPARYEWNVTPPPQATILSGPPEESESTTATFTFVSDVPGSTFQCWLDGLLETCTSPKTYTEAELAFFSGTAAGEHLFAVLPTAPGGITGLEWAEYEWVIGDFTPPITVITSGPDVETEETSATFEFVSEPGATFLCSLDGRQPMPCTSPHVIPRVHPGPHVFEVMAVTPLLVEDPLPSVYEWTVIDLEPPTTEIQYGPPATTVSIFAYFGFSSDDPTAIFECFLDGAALGECDPLTVLEDLPVGPHTLAVRAVDLAGNVDATPATHAWTITASGPPNTPVGTNVVVELPMPDGPGTATLTFLEVAIAGFTSIDVLTGAPPLPAGYALAGGRFYDISSTAEGEPLSLCLPYDLSLFPEGVPVRLLHFDGEAWLDVTTLTNPFTGIVCGLPESFSPFALATGTGLTPLASIISGPPAVSNSGTATFEFISDQPDTLFLCSIDGLPFVGCTSPVTYTHLQAGDNTFMVQAVGPDGQMQLIPSLYEWTIILPPDTTPPDTTITKGPPALTVNMVNTFEFTGTDDQTHPLELEFECALDGGPFAACEVLEEVEVLTAGTHTFEVRAIDLALNVDPTPATRIWTVVDLSAPETTIDLGPVEETTSTNAVFEFSGVDGETEQPVFEFECSLDNADFTNCTSPQEYTGLALGPHSFQVRARDLAGVVDPTPEFYEWLILGSIDTTAPDTVIVVAPPSPSGPDVLFAFAASEPVSEFQCSVDGGAFEGCEAVYELLGLETGEHTLRVRALDLAEPPNVDPTPAMHTWTTVGEPDTFILTGPPDPSAGFNATFTFESDQEDVIFECSVDGAAFAACTSPVTHSGLAAGKHTFAVRATDPAGNVEPTPASHTWTIEEEPPPDGGG